jgi:hypothetical protein
MNDREKWLHATGGYDAVGRRVPRQLGLPEYLLLVARIEPARVRRVPARAVVDDGIDDDGEWAFVACPCGAQPVVRRALEKCRACERYYVFISPGFVFLSYGSMTPPELAR